VGFSNSTPARNALRPLIIEGLLGDVSSMSSGEQTAARKFADAILEQLEDFQELTAFKDDVKNEGFGIENTPLVDITIAPSPDGVEPKPLVPVIVQAQTQSAERLAHVNADFPQGRIKGAYGVEYKAGGAYTPLAKRKDEQGLV
jgi:hypothetical protein